MGTLSFFSVPIFHSTSKQKPNFDNPHTLPSKVNTKLFHYHIIMSCYYYNINTHTATNTTLSLLFFSFLHTKSKLPIPSITLPTSHLSTYPINLLLHLISSLFFIHIFIYQHSFKNSHPPYFLSFNYVTTIFHAFDWLHYNFNFVNKKENYYFSSRNQTKATFHVLW